MADQYHHGNLKQTLIDTGIRIMNEAGEQGLSLRKVAAACGVSHAAPYAHFADKEALLEAMKESVTNQFMEELTKAVAAGETKSPEEKIILLGKRYVTFFMEHPDYFTFLFYKQNPKIHLSFRENYPEDYAPFLLFKELLDQYYATCKKEALVEEKEVHLIRAWTVVHGLASMVCMKNVSASKDWECYLDQLIQ